MSQMFIGEVRKQYPDLTDKQAAEKIVEKTGCVVVLRYAVSPGGPYVAFGICRTYNQVDFYLCHDNVFDVDILYDRRNFPPPSLIEPQTDGEDKTLKEEDLPPWTAGIYLISIFTVLTIILTIYTFVQYGESWAAFLASRYHITESISFIGFFIIGVVFNFIAFSFWNMLGSKIDAILQD